MNTWITSLLFVLILCTISPTVTLSQDNQIRYRHTLETSPMSPVFRIYGVQYAYQTTLKDELLLGLVYANIKYDKGQSHAPTLILGYRRYLWRELHAEYQIWPAYNNYYERIEKKHYGGFELWNELRIGYRIHFTLWDIPFVLTPQILGGFGLYQGNKPESFKKQVKDEPLFIYPNLFVGVRF